MKNLKLLAQLLLYWLVISLGIGFFLYSFGVAVDFVRLIYISLSAYAASVLVFCAIIILRVKTLTNLLDQKCDPEAFLKRHAKMKKSFNKETNCIYENLGLYYLGKTDEAFDVLKQIDIDTCEDLGTMLSYYNAVAAHYEAKGDLACFQMTIDFMQKILDEKVTDEKHKKDYKETIEFCQHCYYLESGNLDGCEDYFKNKLESAKINLAKVRDSGNLGAYYFLTNQYEKAAPLFEYVVNNGNKLYSLVSNAEKRLGEMGERR